MRVFGEKKKGVKVIINSTVSPFSLHLAGWRALMSCFGQNPSTVEDVTLKSKLPFRSFLKQQTCVRPSIIRDASLTFFFDLPKIHFLPLIRPVFSVRTLTETFNC